MKYYTLLFLLTILACKEKSSSKSKEKQLLISNSHTRTGISIDNEVFHFKFNRKNNKKEDSDVFGTYSIDRFNKIDGSLKLDGISDFVEIYNIAEVNPKKEITISIWYKPDSYKGMGQNAIVWKGYDIYDFPYGQYFISATGNLYPKNPGSFKLGFSINGKLSHLKTEEDLWKPGNWYNLTGTYNGNKMELYVNGELVAQRNINGELDTYDTPVLIGKTPHKEFYTSGEYDDFRIFNRALTEKEIISLYIEK